MSSYSLNAVVIALYGLAHGGMFDVMYITTLELVGKETYPTVLGIVWLLLELPILWALQ